MKFVIYYFYIIIFFLKSYLFAENKHPIILIHGFLGWGREEMGNYFYWGGSQDFQQNLREDGFEVYTVSVGPISSNYDRAIETFYQIKGGQLDYGTNYSENLNIIQKPINKYYKGFFPEWSAQNPIHIIGHSMGGQTARMLEKLLKLKIKDETSILLSNEYSGWIKSISTISTPHNGSTLVPIMLQAFPFALNIAPLFGGIDIEIINKYYNFDLEHWGVHKRPGEPLNKYYQRISESPLIISKNICSWDLSPEGAKEFNTNYTSDPDVYYFSYSTSATEKKTTSAKHKPNNIMSLHLWPTSLLIGNYTNAADTTWYENDGICNTVSMTHPHNEIFVIYNGKPQKGVWQHINKLKYDHQAVVGHSSNKNEIQNIYALYKQHSNLLYSLP